MNPVTHEQYDAICSVIDQAKSDDRYLDTDEYASAIVAALSPACSGEVYVIQSEGGDVIDVTNNREWAEWLTREGGGHPIPHDLRGHALGGPCRPKREDLTADP